MRIKINFKYNILWIFLRGCILFGTDRDQTSLPVPFSFVQIMIN